MTENKVDQRILSIREKALYLHLRTSLIALPQHAPNEITERMLSDWSTSLKYFNMEEINCAFDIAYFSLLQWPTMEDINLLCKLVLGDMALRKRKYWNDKTGPSIENEI